MLDLLDSLGAHACVSCKDAPAVHVPGPLGGQLCVNCLAEIPPVPLPLRHAPGGVRAAWALGPYAGPLGAMVRAAKYGGNEAILRALGAICAMADLPHVDLVAPVPSSPWRRLVRGSNPADLLALPVASALGVPLVQALRRGRNAPQAGLRRRIRPQNARGAFQAVVPVEGRVLLVDDVLTTGATAQACADELLGAGADEVLLLVVAATPGACIPVS